MADSDDGKTDDGYTESFYYHLQSVFSLSSTFELLIITLISSARITRCIDNR